MNNRLVLSLVVICLFLLASRASDIVSFYFFNLGTLSLVRKDDQGVVESMRKGLDFNLKSSLANHRLTQAYLRLNQPEQALKIAQWEHSLFPSTSSILLLGDVYDRLGKIQQAIAYYEASETENRQLQLAVNYLQLADQMWDDEEQSKAAVIWRDKVRGTGYGDLYANWRLAQYYAYDEEAVGLYQEASRYFPSESIALSPDSRLDKYQVQAILGAVSDGLWTRDTLLNVIAYRVWQDQSPVTKALLELLLSKKPDDADLRFYQGQMYHRQGDLEQAETAYQQVLVVDTDYAQAYLQLGMIAEDTSKKGGGDKLIEALGWYEKHYALVPNDLLGLKKLKELYTALRRPEAANFQKELLISTDDQYIVSEVLGVPMETVVLESNLLPNQGFESWEAGQPNDWVYFTAVGPENPLFVNSLSFSGRDDFASWHDNSIRIINLWSHPLGKGSSSARFGYRSTGLSIEASKFYLVTVYYRTVGMSGDRFGAIWFNKQIPVDNIWLPATENSWRRFVAIGQEQMISVVVRDLMVFSHSTGSLWFDDLQIKAFSLNSDVVSNNVELLPVILIK